MVVWLIIWLVWYRLYQWSECLNKYVEELRNGETVWIIYELPYRYWDTYHIEWQKNREIRLDRYAINRVNWCNMWYDVISTVQCYLLYYVR